MPLLKLLNVRNTIIKTISMLSSHSNICVGSRMALIDWFFSLLWVILFCFFVCLVIFHWILDTVNLPYWTRYLVVSRIYLNFVFRHS